MFKQALTAVREGSVDHAPADLGGKLQWLRRFGQPRMGVYTRGWHASIEMNTNTVGSKFEVCSDFAHAAPEPAVDQLIERMLSALKAARQDTPADGRS